MHTITNVRIVANPPSASYSHTLYYTANGKDANRPLYGNETMEQAIEDTLAYFGGLIRREDIKIT